MRGEQRPASLGQRCDEILALIDTVLNERGIVQPTTPPPTTHMRLDGATHVGP
jgi:hypothetical protein